MRSCSGQEMKRELGKFLRLHSENCGAEAEVVQKITESRCNTIEKESNESGQSTVCKVSSERSFTVGLLKKSCKKSAGKPEERMESQEPGSGYSVQEAQTVRSEWII